MESFDAALSAAVRKWGSKCAARNDAPLCAGRHVVRACTGAFRVLISTSGNFGSISVNSSEGRSNLNTIRRVDESPFEEIENSFQPSTSSHRRAVQPRSIVTRTYGIRTKAIEAV